MPTVERYDPSKSCQWEEFLLSARNATFLFSRGFMEYHSDRFADYSLVVKDEHGNLQALLPANLTKDNVVVSHQGLTYGGLIVKRDAKMLPILSYLSAVLQFLHQEGITTLHYKEIPSIYSDIPCDEIQYALFLLKAELTRRDAVTVVNNSFKLPFQKRRAKSAQAARKAGVEIRQDNDFDAFWNLILNPNLLQKHGIAPVHNLDEIQRLHHLFPQNIKQYNAYHNGKITGGTTIFEMEYVVNSQYCSASEEGRKNGCLDLLFDELLNHVYASKRHFSFGNSNENNGLKVNVGLLDWKEGLGARTCSQNFYSINTANYPLLEKCSENKTA